MAVFSSARHKPWSSVARTSRECLAACLLAGAVFAVGSAFAAPLGFDEALAAAERHSAALAARRASIEGAQQQQTAAGRLPDPKLSVGVENVPISGPDRFSWNRESMTMRRIGLMQDVPNAAKRAAQRSVAAARIGSTQAQLQAERLAVRRETASAWLALHYAERKLALFAKLERENRVLQDTIAARVAAGGSMPADALMARQELLALADRRDELRAASDQAAAALRRWVGEQVERTAPVAPTFHVDPADVLARLDRHADLLAYAPMLAMAQREVDEAQAAKRGDWGWEVAYANRSRAYGDMVSFQLSFELPVSSATRQEPQIAARQREVSRIESEREDTLRRVRADVQSQLAELLRLERTLQRQQEAIGPLTSERVQLSLASYQSGRGDLAAVLTARKDAAEAQLRTLDLEGQVMIQRVRLAYLITE